MTNIALADVADTIMDMNITTTIMNAVADTTTDTIIMTMNADVDMTMDTTTTIIMNAVAADVADMTSQMKM